MISFEHGSALTVHVVNRFYSAHFCLYTCEHNKGRNTCRSSDLQLEGPKWRQTQYEQQWTAIRLTAGWICLQEAECGGFSTRVSRPHGKHFISGRQAEWQVDAIQNYRSTCTRAHWVLLSCARFRALPVDSCLVLSDDDALATQILSVLIVHATTWLQRGLIAKERCPTPNPAGSGSTGSL